MQAIKEAADKIRELAKLFHENTTMLMSGWGMQRQQYGEANDGLRGLPVAQMKQNLGRIIETSRQAGAKVLLLGMRMPPNYGPAYTRDFEAAYRELAQRYKVALLPFFLQSVAARPDLFQADQLHPTAVAQPMILEDVWKALQPLL